MDLFTTNKKTLDNEQKAAVYACPNEPLLILAPPGAGKTFVMTKRIEYLIELGIIKKPFKILGLTFTNAAANEMKKRVIKEVPQSEGLIHITNFHSFSYSILKAYGNLIGLNENFSIVSEIYSEKILKKILSKNNVQKDSYQNWKNEKILKCNFKNNDYRSKEYAVFTEYNNNLIINNLVDYDNLLFYAIKILKTYPQVLSYYRATFRYILIDEYQDTNALQFKLLSLLVQGMRDLREFNDPNVFILADPNQAIFEFQGSDIRNIIKAKKRFGCKKLKLKGEYRFNSEGIKLLKKSISSFIDKENLENKNIKERPCYTIFENKKDEANYIIEKIKDKKEKGIGLHEIAVLAPSNFYFNIIKKKLKENNIDYVLINDFKGSSISRNRKYQRIFEILNENVNDCSENSLTSIFEVACKENLYNYDKDEILRFLLELSKKYDIDPSKSIDERYHCFLNEVFLEIDWAEFMRKRIKNKIFLSSIHGSKGLEFDYIFICGLVKDLLPHKTFCSKCNEIIDYNQRIKELKLLNVGVSRAKKKLYITSFNKRLTHETCILKPFYEYLEVTEKY